MLYEAKSSDQFQEWKAKLLLHMTLTPSPSSKYFSVFPWKDETLRESKARIAAAAQVSCENSSFFFL